MKKNEYGQAKTNRICPAWCILSLSFFAWLRLLLLPRKSFKCKMYHFFLLRVFFAAVIGRENGLHMYAGLWRYVGMYPQVAALYQLTKISTHVPNTCTPAPHPSSKKAKKNTKKHKILQYIFSFLGAFFWIAAARLGVQWRNVECTVIRPCMCAGCNKIQRRVWIMCFFGSPW